MSKLKTTLHLIKTPGKMVMPLAEKGVFNWMPDEQYLKLVYRGVFGKKLDLDDPKTFNEKLQWLKLHDRNPAYHQMVDKYDAKEYVAEMIGEEYLIPTLGVWDSAEEIPFEKLPDQFVLKCTHDSGSIVICQDRAHFDETEARNKLKKAMQKSIFWFGREWPYKGLKARIIAEPYLEDHSVGELRDYKFFCFNGKVKCFKVDFDRFINHGANYYDAEGNYLEIGEVVCPPNPGKRILLPKNLNKMTELAEKLSEGYPFLRVDFYDVDGKIYFGELTLFPASGLSKFTYTGNDELLGTWLKLPE